MRRPARAAARGVALGLSLSAALGLALAPRVARAQDAGDAATRAEPFREPYRPQYHFTPAANWMNDPNGLVYADGLWHLFYQFNPFGATWGHMSWGHAASPDLVHWRHLPLALPEAGAVMAFSGSAVVDSANTSGLGRGGRPPLVAVYTGASPGRQAQYVASSTDGGRTWARRGGGPVLDVGSGEFRDPKVFWYAAERKWVMVVSLATLHRVRLYASPDLVRWTPMSEFGPAGATGGVWECPDLFELPVAGSPGETRWVLVVNLNPGGVAGGSGAQYFVGRFDGTRFTADDAAAATADSGAPAVRWADYGRDFYAAQSWSGVPRADGRRVWIAWMNNWAYGEKIPTAPWRSAQSLPRALGLVGEADGRVALVQEPVRELERLRGPERALGPETVAEGTTPLAGRGVGGAAVEIEATFAVDADAAAPNGPRSSGARPAGAREFGLKVRTGPGEETVVGIDPVARRLFVDRTRSGRAGFAAGFAGRQGAPLPVEGGLVRLRVFVDWSSVEVFAGGGRVAITDQVFPAPASDGVALYAVGGQARLVSLRAWPLAPAWGAPAR